VRLYIKRRDEDAVRAIGNWTLIYGRRKTGKTTLVKRNLRMDLYILIVDPGNAITLDDRVVKVDEAMRAVRRMSKVAERVGLVSLRRDQGISPLETLLAIFSSSLEPRLRSPYPPRTCA
jgi:hypothetical protein